MRPIRRYADWTFLALAIFVQPCVVAGGRIQREAQGSHPSKAPAWKLVWSDEFDGPNGAPPNPEKWTFATGGNGWGNNELEYYTARTVNAQQRDGNLVISVAHESYVGADGVKRDYTSARL